MADTPVRSGYLEALAGMKNNVGPYARVETGIRPAQNLALFGYGEWARQTWEAGAGVRWTFGW